MKCSVTSGFMNCRTVCKENLCEGANDDVKRCDTAELLDQNFNDTCKLLSMPNFDERIGI